MLQALPGFNPRTYTRYDDVAGSNKFVYFVVSIHAPTRGATVTPSRPLSAFNGFNPRTYTRCDTFGRLKQRRLNMFQSTHLHEVRHLWPAEAKEAEHVSIHAPTRGATICGSICFVFIICFNPRTYTRCDNEAIHAVEVRLLVSIHAPTRGATIRVCARKQALAVSIHAPTRGATHTLTRISRKPDGFNPRTYTRCDYPDTIN